MAEGLVGQGLKLFSSGDLEGATRIWLRAQVDDPENGQLKAYLDHIRMLHPEIIRGVIDSEGVSLGTMSNSPATEPGGGRTTSSAPIPVPVAAPPEQNATEGVNLPPLSNQGASLPLLIADDEVTIPDTVPMPVIEKPKSNPVQSTGLANFATRERASGVGVYGPGSRGVDRRVESMPDPQSTNVPGALPSPGLSGLGDTLEPAVTVRLTKDLAAGSTIEAESPVTVATPSISPGLVEAESFDESVLAPNSPALSGEFVDTESPVSVGLASIDTATAIEEPFASSSEPSPAAVPDLGVDGFNPVPAGAPSFASPPPRAPSGEVPPASVAPQPMMQEISETSAPQWSPLAEPTFSRDDAEAAVSLVPPPSSPGDLQFEAVASMSPDAGEIDDAEDGPDFRTDAFPAGVTVAISAVGDDSVGPLVEYTVPETMVDPPEPLMDATQPEAPPADLDHVDAPLSGDVGEPRAPAVVPLGLESPTSEFVAPAFTEPPGPVAIVESGVVEDPWGEPSAVAEIDPGAGGLGLVERPEIQTAESEARPATTTPIDELAPKLKELLDLDDFSGALEVSEKILAADAAHLAALAARSECTENLLRMYRSKIGDLEAVPRVEMGPEEVIWLDLDHRSGFVLSQIDGVSSFEDIVELSGMPQLEAFRILSKLVQDKVVGASPP